MKILERLNIPARIKEKEKTAKKIRALERKHSELSMLGPFVLNMEEVHEKEKLIQELIRRIKFGESIETGSELDKLNSEFSPEKYRERITVLEKQMERVGDDQEKRRLQGKLFSEREALRILLDKYF